MSTSLRRFTKVQAARTLLGLVPHMSIDNIKEKTLTEDIDDYARRHRAIADEVWEKEYAQRFTRKIKSVRYV